MIRVEKVIEIEPGDGIDIGWMGTPLWLVLWMVVALFGLWWVT